MTPEMVDKLLGELLTETLNRTIKHDSRTDPQGYAELVKACVTLGDFLTRGEYVEEAGPEEES